MVLLFDIGNSNIVLGVVNDNKVVKTFRYLTNPMLTEEDYYLKINLSLQTFKEKVEGAIISSVVPSLDRVFVLMIKKYFEVTPLVVGPGLKSGLVIKLENPKQLGADLLCDVVGAYNKYGGPTIVVDLGTATKLLVVTKNKEFIGGAICAGLKVSLDSLIKTTSKLSETSLEVPEKVINNETSACIKSGIVYGHIAMIEGLVNRTIAELGLTDYKVVVTGGLSGALLDHLPDYYIFDKTLLLDGLLYIYNKNKI